MKFNESTLPDNFSKGIFEDKGLDLSPDHIDKISDVVFTAIANILNASKSKNTPTAFVVKKLNGMVVGAAVVKFFENTDANNPGNWSLVYTFDEADIPENALKIEINDTQTHSYFTVVGGKKYSMGFSQSSDIVDLTVYLFEQIKKWLDENAKENEEVVLEQDAVFQARVAVVNGEKVFALEPAGEIKNLIKDDAAIEK